MREGGRVFGADGSGEFLERAKRRPSGENIKWAIVNALDEEAIADLGGFDAVVCTMALMDLPDIGPLFRGARRLLSTGPLVVVTAHPSFNHPDATFWSEAGEDTSGQAWSRRGLKLSAYASPYQQPVFGMPGQQTPQWYFHRPLHQLLTPAFGAGLWSTPSKSRHSQMERRAGLDRPDTRTPIDSCELLTPARSRRERLPTKR